MKKKILFVINTLGQAGAETALMALLGKLDPGEYDISLYVLLGQGEMVNQLPEYVHLLNREYRDFSVLSKEGQQFLKRSVMKAFFKRGNWLRLLPYLCRNAVSMLSAGKLLADKLLWRVVSDGAELLDTYYDLAVAYLEGGSTYYVADHVKARKKAAFVHVDYEKAGYTRALDHCCYEKMDQIFAVSDEVREAFLKVYPECGEKLSVFHNLLDKKRIFRMAEEGNGFADSFDGKRILSVGRLTTQKAFEISIGAMKLLKDRGLRLRWYVLGEGDKRSKLEAQIKELGLTEDFILMGAVANPYPYMKEADIYVHASRFEGKSIAIQEAQLLGKPILASDCSGNREQVIHGVDGLLCELSPEAVCDGILLLLQDEAMCLRFGEAAQMRNENDDTEIRKLLSMI